MRHARALAVAVPASVLLIAGLLFLASSGATAGRIVTRDRSRSPSRAGDFVKAHGSISIDILSDMRARFTLNVE